MVKGSRQRLIAAANRLILNKTITARAERKHCCFCNVPIRALDQYKTSGQNEAHEVCVKAVLNELRPIR